VLKAAKYLSTIKYQIKSFPERYHALEAILIEPADDIKQHNTVAKGGKRPLIMFPHGTLLALLKSTKIADVLYQLGGPHAANTTGFSALTVTLVSLDFSVALGN
jgi:hypothetical protein